MKNAIVFLTFILMHCSLFAHEGGHSIPSHTWTIAATNEQLKADFIGYENSTVWLLDENHQRLGYALSDFNTEDQNYITAKSKELTALNTESHPSTEFSAWKYVKRSLLLLGGILVLFSAFQLYKQRKKMYWGYGIIGMGLIVVVSCKNTITTITTTNQQVPENNLAEMKSFFGKMEGVTTYSDANYLYVSSNGLPNHDMMVGITNWQQQVPIPQNYTGSNSWAIPLRPKMAAHPLSTATNLLKGAIAVAVNGIPIFNPLNNRGEDANAIGELDQWGGHCGRADDYHYHLPPLHLQEKVGIGNPIAYAVDGFPVYGETTEPLDAYLGKLNPDGCYQYHTIKEYPYFIAGMRGEVKLDPNSKAPENQVAPQPRTQELRPALRPLRGAEIIGFKNTGANSYALSYRLDAKEYIIKYKWNTDKSQYTYEFIAPDGTSTTEKYQPRK